MTIWYAGMVTLAGAVLITLSALFLILRQRPALAVEQAQSRVYRVRTRYFAVLLIAVALTLGLTLRRLPYAGAQAVGEPAATIRVDGMMWAWHMEQIAPRPLDSAGGGVAVPAGRPVVFEVRGMDVNHGFGVYTPDGALLGQAQAMPGYTNRLTMTFPAPGRYPVLCLEYCGQAHHVMLGAIEVY